MSQTEVTGFSIERSNRHHIRWENNPDQLPANLKEYSCNMQSVSFVYREEERYHICLRIYCDETQDNQRVQVFLDPRIVKKIPPGSRDKEIECSLLNEDCKAFNSDKNIIQLKDMDPQYIQQYLIAFPWPHVPSFNQAGDYSLVFRIGIRPPNAIIPYQIEKWTTQSFDLRITKSIPH